MTEIEKQMQEVVESRLADYMDFTQFCILLPNLRSHIRTNIMSNKALRNIFGINYCNFKQVCKFTKTMLAMKALRTFTCSEQSFQDSIIDFVNYRNLANSSFVKLSGSDKVCLQFSSEVYNYRLNDGELDINKIKYLVESKYKELVMENLKYSPLATTKYSDNNVGRCMV